MLLNATVDSASYALSERFSSLKTPKYYNHRRKKQSSPDQRHQQANVDLQTDQQPEQELQVPPGDMDER